MMKISNKFPHNITITSTNDVFYFSPILTDELGLCYTFNSRISSYLSPQCVIKSFSLFFLVNFFSALFTGGNFVGFSFLVSGNLENTSRVKSLEEINYFDGDASAVTADLSNNVDVTFSPLMLGEVLQSLSKTISDLLPRSERVAVDAEADCQ
jgi:hypothetical protein